MHRSRLSVLAIVAASAAACSTHTDADGRAPLAQDASLVARLQVDDTKQPPLPSACGTVAAATFPVAAQKSQADELARKAYDAEIMGNVQQARTLLRQATTLDATNKSAAYHLGVTSEASGDSAAAISAYCRYLALTPSSSDAAEARQRVARLSPLASPVSHVSTGAVSESATTHKRSTSVAVRHTTHVRSTAASPRTIARATVVHSAARTPSSEPMASSPSEAQLGRVNSDAGGDVVATSPIDPTAEQPASAPQAQRRRPSRTQGALIGAATGAIIGAATGRSVKGAVIGAAAGGVLGGVVVHGRSYAERGARR